VVIVAELLPAWPDDSLDEAVATPDVSRTGLVAVQCLPLLVRGGGSTPDPMALALIRQTEVEPAERTVPLVEVATRGDELVSAAALLAADVLADDGIGDLHVLSPDGHINPLAARPSAVRDVRAWAERRGIRTVDRV
jgi:hypothetical protein